MFVLLCILVGIISLDVLSLFGIASVESAAKKKIILSTYLMFAKIDQFPAFINTSACCGP